MGYKDGGAKARSKMINEYSDSSDSAQSVQHVVSLLRFSHHYLVAP